MIEPKTLPVYQNKKLILDSLSHNQVIIVESPTGSGKTTQIPLILKEAGYSDSKVIGVTQPRRIATLSVCEFINKQIKDEMLPNGFCAYKMRFWDTTNEDTKIKILTDGMLLQELKTDPLLNRYSVIMIDEAHERSLNIDLILGLLKQVVKQRPEFKVIISSATINTKVFSDFFYLNGKKAPIITIDAKTFDVDLKYYPLKVKNDLSEICHSICQIISFLLKEFKINAYTNSKDVLVFLPGELEIKEAEKAIYEFCDYKFLKVIPLYGRLSKEEQEKVFIQTPKGKIKVVLATNIAETSLTIEGIRVVIDSGLCRMNYYNQYDFTSSLITKPISKSSAQQRTGRAGRTDNGTCFRLYSKDEFDNKTEFTQEEILRTDLSEVVLRMVDLGIKDIEHFDFITKPGSKPVQSAINTLEILGAIDSDRNLTQIGEIMVKFPLSPRLSRCLVHAMKTGPKLIWSVCICISFLSCKTPFVLPVDEENAARDAHSTFSSRFGDFIAYQQLYLRYISLPNQEAKENFCKNFYLDFQSMEEIYHVTNQLCDIVTECGFDYLGNDITKFDYIAKELLQCMLVGLIQFVCINKKGTIYRTITTDEIYIHPGSAYFKRPPKFLLAGEIVNTSRMYARTVSPLEESWIEEINSGLCSKLKKISNYKEKDYSDRISRKSNKKEKTINLYGIEYYLENSVAVIPYEKLYALARAYRKASRHPKKVYATILYKGKFVCYNQKLPEVLDTGLRLNQLPDRIVENGNYTVFYQSENIEQLIPFLNSLMGLCHLDKYRDRWGFLELISTKNSFFLHSCNSFNEALNNTAYSLLTIMEFNKSKEFKYAYNRVVRLLD